MLERIPLFLTKFGGIKYLSISQIFTFPANKRSTKSLSLSELTNVSTIVIARFGKSSRIVSNGFTFDPS